ncbi:MAG: glycosyltransferase family 2 protein [Jejuia sp.]
MAKVSIILPSYNHKRFLEQRLDSIVSQSFKDWEIIIIDDCSTDGSIELLDEFVKKHSIKVSYYSINKINSKSGYTSWKRGIKKARSKYIWIAETDDYCAPDFLEELVEILDTDKDIKIAFSVSDYVNEKGEFLYNSSNRTAKLNVTKDTYKILDSQDVLKELPFHPYLINASSLVFRNPSEPINNDIFNFKQKSDQFLWTEILKNGKIAFLNKSLSYFRQHSKSTTYQNFEKRGLELFGQNITYCNYFGIGNTKLKQVLEHYIKLVFRNRLYRQVFFPKSIFDLDGVNKLKILVTYFVLLFNYVLMLLKAKIIK